MTWARHLENIVIQSNLWRTYNNQPQFDFPCAKRAVLYAAWCTWKKSIIVSLFKALYYIKNMGSQFEQVWTQFSQFSTSQRLKPYRGQGKRTRTVIIIQTEHDLNLRFSSVVQFSGSKFKPKFWTKHQHCYFWEYIRSRSLLQVSLSDFWFILSGKTLIGENTNNFNKETNYHKLSVIYC